MTGWQQRAACTPAASGLPFYELDAMLFPDTGVSSSIRDVRARAHAGGKRLCAGCPVRVDCLDDALASDGYQPHGVRGGMDPDERAALRRARRRATD